MLSAGVRARARWLWTVRSPTARLARAALLPAAGLYRLGVAARAAAYGAGLRTVRRPALPTIAVGNLTVGGAGKTPLAAWLADRLASRGLRPAIVLRGYGGDEAHVHRALVPAALVIEDPDRLGAVARAAAAGADVAVLDDAFQRLELAPDLNILVVSAESARAAPWQLPAGPWREGWAAARRADLLVVTRKRAGRRAAARLAARLQRAVPGRPPALARLALTGLRGMVSGARRSRRRLAGARVVASAGVADPASLAAQCRRLGARVCLLAWPDHHPYPARDLKRLLHAAHRVDYVVLTDKDAVKLAPRWPAGVPEPLVARLGVVWERGGECVERALAAFAAGAGSSA